MNFQEQLKAKLKLSNVAKGTRAIKKVLLPVVNTPGRMLVDQPELAAQREANGNPERDDFVIGLRALRPDEFETIVCRADQYASKHSVDPAFRNERNPIYSLGYTYNLLAITCVDPDGDPDDPAPFWGPRGDIDAAVETIRKCDHLSRDSLLYLAELQEAWQDQVSPQAKTLTPTQLYELMGEVAASTDASPFLALRPGMQWQLVRFINGLYLSLLTANSPSDSTSSESSSRNPEEVAATPVADEEQAPEPEASE